MHISRLRLTRCVALLGCLVTSLAVLTPLSAASPASTTAASAGFASTATVTLITGDTVTLVNPDSDEPTVTFRPADGGREAGSSSTFRSDGDIYLVPHDVAALVPEVLDLELFNVTGLIGMGYDDATADALPLVVRGPRPLAGFDSAEDSRPLPSIDAVAVVDGDHPDLRGKVGAEADFTDEGTPADGNGHGTHVASIIAGTGAMAEGARKGVAFGADLLSAKVLTSEGIGQAVGHCRHAVGGQAGSRCGQPQPGRPGRGR